MDIAITLSSSLGEIISYEPEKTKAQLYQSGLKVGSDVVGPMVNIISISHSQGLPMEGLMEMDIYSLKIGLSFTELSASVLLIVMIGAVNDMTISITAAMVEIKT